MWLRQSTASQEILLGPFLDSTDGNTAETGLTIANTDIKIWKEGATTEANKNSGGATHIASGRYYAVLDATDTNTLGKMEVNIHVTGALAVRREYMVLPANVYDSLVLGTDKLEVDSTLIEGGDATDAINAACDTALTDYDAPTKAELDSGLAALNDPTAAAIADAVLDEALSGHVTAGSLGKAVADIETDATAILADTNELQTNQGDWATATGFATSSALATVDSNVDAILVDTGNTLPATLSTIAGYIDTEVSAIKAVTDNLPNSGALTSLAQASALTTVDTVVDGIKAKTDSLTFTVAGQVDANVQYVNDVAVTGTGASGDEWGP